MAAPEVRHTSSNSGGCARPLGIGCLVLLALPGIGIAGFALFMIGVLIFSMGAGIFGAGMSMVGSGMALDFLNAFPPFAALGLDISAALAAGLCVVLAIGLIVFALIYTIVYYMRHSSMPKAAFWIIMLVLFLLSLIGTGIYTKRSIESVGSVKELQQRAAELEQIMKAHPDSLERWLDENATHSYYYEYSRDAEGNEYRYEERN